MRIENDISLSSRLNQYLLSLPLTDEQDILTAYL